MEALKVLQRLLSFDAGPTRIILWIVIAIMEQKLETIGIILGDTRIIGYMGFHVVWGIGHVGTFAKLYLKYN